MARIFSEGDIFAGRLSQAPSPAPLPPITSIADQSFDYYELPYVSNVSTRGPDIQSPHDEAFGFFGLPYEGFTPVSYTGPAASVQPRGPASLAGLFAGALQGARGYGASKRSRMFGPLQRDFTVELQERLRRRRKRRF